MENGVTVTILVIGPFDKFVTVNEGILPEPVADASPTAGLLFVQLYIVFGIVEPAKLIAWVTKPVQRAWLWMESTVGLGRICIEKLMDVPLHEFEIGVTVISELIGILKRLVALKVAIEPDPVKGSPMSALLFVQE